MDVLGLLFPKYCVSCKKVGSYICSDCFAQITFSQQEICLPCNKPSLDGKTHPYCTTRYTIDGAWTSIEYKKVTKKLLYQFKYRPYVLHIKENLLDLLYEGIIQKEDFMRVLAHDAIFCPIPLTSAKLKKRGYNQAAILATGLANKFNSQSKELLQRVTYTTSQTELTKQQRRENVTGVFRLKKTISTKTTVILVDDVLTTGSTLLEAAKVLKKSGVQKVYGLALARD